MNKQKPHRLLSSLALIAILSVLLWGVRVSAGAQDDGAAPGETPMATGMATTTSTLEPLESPTIESTAEPTATAAAPATETAAPTATPIANYLPVVARIPPPQPSGCIPAAHIPGDAPHIEHELAVLINAYRQNNGVHRLNVLPHLTQPARRHAQDMAQNDIYDHTGSDGSSVGERVEDGCYDWLNIGEVLGVYYSSQEMFNTWVRLNRNRELILAPEFQDMGVGYVRDPDTRYQHYWVVIFGRSASAGSYESR